MNELVYNQIYVFFIFLLTGICISLLFDFFRIQRRVFKFNNIIIYIQDIIFWILAGTILFYILIRYTDGVIRIYMFHGLVIGIILYFIFVSKFIVNIFSNFILRVKYFFKSLVCKKINKKH